MPLWDFELMNYWKNVHLVKRDKTCINYLKDYNYKNLFKNYRRTQSQFSVQYKWLIIFGNVYRLLFGKIKRIISIKSLNTMVNIIINIKFIA